VANELRAKVRAMEADMLSNEKATFDITAEMTRQYKAMQENLMGKIGVLEGEIHKLKDELGAYPPARAHPTLAHCPCGCPLTQRRRGRCWRRRRATRTP